MEARPWSNYGWHTAREKLLHQPLVSAGPCCPPPIQKDSHTDLQRRGRGTYLCCCSPCSTSVLQLTPHCLGIYQCHTRCTDNSAQHSCQRDLAASFCQRSPRDYLTFSLHSVAAISMCVCSRVQGAIEPGGRPVLPLCCLSRYDMIGVDSPLLRLHPNPAFTDG